MADGVPGSPGRSGGGSGAGEWGARRLPPCFPDDSVAEESAPVPKEVELLVKAKDVKGLAALLEPDRQGELRRSSARALAEMGTPEALDALNVLMSRPEPFISDDLVERVAPLKGEHVIRFFEAALAAEDPFWRSRIVRLVSNREEPGALRFLLRASRDSQSAKKVVWA